RDAVVPRPDAARREHVRIARPAAVHGRDARAEVVAYHPRLLEPDAELRHLRGEKLEVRVLRLAGQKLVADQKHARGRTVLAGHRSPSLLEVSRSVAPRASQPAA